MSNTITITKEDLIKKFNLVSLFRNTFTSGFDFSAEEELFDYNHAAGSAIFNQQLNNNVCLFRSVGDFYIFAQLTKKDKIKSAIKRREKIHKEYGFFESLKNPKKNDQELISLNEQSNKPDTVDDIMQKSHICAIKNELIMRPILEIGHHVYKIDFTKIEIDIKTLEINRRDLDFKNESDLLDVSVYYTALGDDENVWFQLDDQVLSTDPCKSDLFGVLFFLTEEGAINAKNDYINRFNNLNKIQNITI